jgi:uncharacterized membrane protein
MVEDQQIPRTPVKTSLGLQENIEGLLCYVLGWVSGVIFLILEKESKFVKFHAMQSLITFLGLFVINFVIGMIPLIGWLISILSFPIGLILWILLMYKAFKGEMYKLPIVGEIAEKQINK